MSINSLFLSRNSHQPGSRQSLSFPWVLRFTLLLSLVVSGSTLIACNYEIEATPNPTPIPPPTTAPYYGFEVIFVVIQSSESIQLDLLAGDLLKVSYVSLERTTGNINIRPVVDGPVVPFRIIDPLGGTVLQVEALHENQVELRVDHTGAYQMVFTNPYPLQGLEVHVEYAVNP